jgi:hypothetical protein
MTRGFIYGTPMLPKSDESHIAYLIACEVVVYSSFVDYMAIESFLLTILVNGTISQYKTIT